MIDKSLCAYCSEHAQGVKCEYEGSCDQEAARRRKARLSGGGHSRSDVLEWMRRAIERDRAERR